jgi:hypothetical protein
LLTPAALALEILEIPHAMTGTSLAYSTVRSGALEKVMIAFCMMGALAVLLFLSLSGEISNLFRRK